MWNSQYHCLQKNIVWNYVVQQRTARKRWVRKERLEWYLQFPLLIVWFVVDSPSDWRPGCFQHNSGRVCPLPDHTFPQHRPTGPQTPLSPTPVGGVSSPAATARHTERQQLSQDQQASARHRDQGSPLWWDRFSGQPGGCRGWHTQCRQRWHLHYAVVWLVSLAHCM